jgi:hypothetical protein
MDKKNDLQKIKKMYENLNFFDQYSGSLIIVIIVIIFVTLFTSYCYVKIYSQSIIDDWPNQRCNPLIIPFAGYITHPEGVTASEYTSQNWDFCNQNIISGVTGIALEPLTFITNMLNSVADQVKKSIQSIRAMFSKVRDMFQKISQEIMSRIINFMIPLEQIIISFKDLLSKTQGTMTAGLFTLLGSYNTLQSLMGAIAQFILTILIALAAMIAAFWAVPFTWGAAIANTAIFIAISIPMSIILAFMIDVLKVKTSLSIPKIKCFDKNTLIKMKNGTMKKISEIVLGEILYENNEVTAIIKVETKGSKMYTLNGVAVSDTHVVKYQDKWIRVIEHPDAVLLKEYNEPYLYCLNTTNKTILINENIFTDWDEIYENDITQILNNDLIKINDVKDIHTYLDGGFHGNTKVQLKNGNYKEINKIQIGDILEHGETIYGIVEINGKNVNEQYQINLGDNIQIKGGPNLTIYDKTIYNTLSLETNKTKLKIKENKLYHLLTDTKFFYIDKVKFYDYNTCIDLFLEKK